LGRRKPAREHDGSVHGLPFVKWAGGKTQILPALIDNLPDGLQDGSIKRYVEPFVGGGALFFSIIRLYPIRECLIADSSEELILTYKSIQADVEAVIEFLSAMEKEFYDSKPDKDEGYYYAVRERFNENRVNYDFKGDYDPTWAERAAQMLFLNRTCFNGLYRVNSQGNFNVPFGKYKQPHICNTDNLRAVSAILQKTVIKLGDFEECGPSVDAGTFVYCDPPYRPISRTSNFTSYSKTEFDDVEQLRLADFYKRLDAIGAKIMLSNSDPKNVDGGDDFFERTYAAYHIRRISANRIINSKAEGRGAISELIITNY
jgi:DNA adenine methylase